MKTAATALVDQGMSLNFNKIWFGFVIVCFLSFILQHIGGTMVKMEAATIVNHNVLIVAEQTALSVYRCELLLQRTGVTL